MSKIIQQLIFVFCFLAVTSVSADQLQFEQSQLTTTQHQLVIDQKSNQLARNRLAQFEKNHDQMLAYYQQHGVTKGTLKQAEIDILSAQTNLSGIKMALEAAKDQRSRLKDNIADLTKDRTRLELLKSEDPQLKFTLAEVVRKLDLVNALIVVQQTRIQVLKSTELVAQQTLDSTNEWYKELRDLQLKQRHEALIEQSTQEMKALQSRLDRWIVTLTELNQRIEALTQKGESAEAQMQSLNLQVIEASENVELTRLDVYLLTLQNDIRRAAEGVKQDLSVTSLNSMASLTTRTQKQVKDALSFVESKVKYLELKKGQFSDSSTATSMAQILSTLDVLEAKYQEEIERLNDMSAKLEKVQLQLNKSLAKQVAQRQELPGFDYEGWRSLAGKAVQVPIISYEFTKSAVRQIKSYFESQTSTIQYVFIFAGLVIFFSGIFLRIVLGTLAKHLIENRERFTVNMTYTLVELLRRTLPAWLLFGILMTLSFISGADLSLFSYATVTYIIFKTLISAARISLLESVTDVGGDDVKLYYQLKWAFLFGGMLSLVIVVAHLLPVGFEIKALVNRMFMVFVLLLGVLILQGRHFLPELMDSHFKVRRRYVYHALRILSILLPAALVSNAIIGLFGYVELAWTIAKMQGIFLIVLAAYLILRGLVIDLLDYGSELIIKYSANGWVWTEAFLKPLDKIMRFVTFFLAIFALIHLYDLDRNVTFVTSASNIINKKLFSLGTNDITPLFIVKFIIFVAVVYWAARWTREFSIRWWYSRYKDLGLRNSLSIFTQYAVAIAGVLIGLQIIGVDLSGLAVVAAAFFAGIGFGLRDLVSNYFSGFLLLVERPFRRGDIVKLGEFEGEIVHQGMRSTTVRTWDHMEVIVPNSEMFTKPFVNWTHQDSMVRSVIKLNVHRMDNPHLIKSLVCTVLVGHPAVLEKPEPHVLMKEISETLVEMEVRYFLVVGAEHSRVKVRSQILFAIYDIFKAHGIKSPFPQYDIHVTNPQLVQTAVEPAT